MDWNPEIVEEYLMRGELAYDTVEPGLWILHDDVENVDNIVVQYTPPIIVFRVKLMNVPSDEKKRDGLFEKLLRLNATEMVSGAYGLEGNAIIATETLQVENLDFNEFQASLDGLTLSITEHFQALWAFHGESTSDQAAE